MTEMEFMSISRMSNAIKPTAVLALANEPSMRSGGISNRGPKNASPGKVVNVGTTSFVPNSGPGLAMSQAMREQESSEQ